MTGPLLATLSQWIDDGNAHRDPEAITWGRLAKVSEECGEVIEAFIGATGQNPRKGVCHSMDDVAKELLDVAVTALAAYEHLHGNDGTSDLALAAHVDALCTRAGLAPVAADVQPGPAKCQHADSLYGRCANCGMTWGQQAGSGGWPLSFNPHHLRRPSVSGDSLEPEGGQR